METLDNPHGIILLFLFNGMRYIGEGIYWILLCFLVIAASFYTWEVSQFKTDLRAAGKEADFDSGQLVDFRSALDGDEIAVGLNGQHFVVRLLGIKSLSDGASKNHPLKNTARNYLNKVLVGRPVRLEFTEFKKDRYNRILAYVHNQEEDMGRVMVDRGWAFAYDKYPFNRAADYRIIEDKAKKDSRGFWQQPATVERIQKLRQLWESRP